MTPDSSNPYEPSAIVGETATGESLQFAGTIEESDYLALMPKWDLERVLCLVLAILVAICLLIFGPVTTIFAVSDGKIFLAIGLGCFWLTLLLSLWFLKRRIASKDIAARMLRKHPDVLGEASGRLFDSGWTFSDGERTYWFSPSSASRSAIQTNGARLELWGIKYRYIALTKRTFENYDYALAKRLHIHWTTVGKNQDSVSLAEVVEVWEKVCERPATAIAFSGEVTLAQPRSVSMLWQSHIPSIFAYSGLLVVVVFFRDSLSSSSFILGVIATSYCLVQSVLVSLRNYFNIAPASWHQFGWLSDSHIAICTHHGGVNFPLSDIAEFQIESDAIHVITSYGSAYTIPKQSTTDATSWKRLVEIAERIEERTTDEPHLNNFHPKETDNAT